MAKRIVCLTILSVLFLCAFSFAYGTVPSLPLEYKFKQGSVNTYKFVMEMKITVPGTSMGSKTTKMSGKSTQKVLSVLSDGSAKIESIISDMKIVSLGTQSGQPVKSTRIVTTMTKYGQVISVDGMDNLKSKSLPGIDLSSMFNQSGAAFPGKPVEVGDTWKQSIPMPAFGANIDVTSTLIDASAVVANMKTAKIKQTYSGRFDMAQIMKQLAASSNSAGASAMAQIAGTLDMTGSSLVHFSPELGRIIKTNMLMTANTVLTMPSDTTDGGEAAEMHIIADMKFDMWRIQ